MIFFDLWIAMWDMVRFCSLVFRWGTSKKFFFQKFRLRTNVLIENSKCCNFGIAKMSLSNIEYVFISPIRIVITTVYTTTIWNTMYVRYRPIVYWINLEYRPRGRVPCVPETSEDNWAREKSTESRQFSFFFLFYSFQFF